MKYASPSSAHLKHTVSQETSSWGSAAVLASVTRTMPFQPFQGVHTSRLLYVEQLCLYTFWLTEVTNWGCALYKNNISCSLDPFVTFADCDLFRQVAFKVFRCSSFHRALLCLCLLPFPSQPLLHSNYPLI